ncbi:hypothetical protein GN244_ATG15504 [Phytophthora infestans]|uniref:Uncharacterized protein n=1 Tax=Phytophthora infestans TaxID=4787 RepID=A0A833W8A4_PHYIN|nr:hypothetical protein GN244_ATG15504 [Phytophthora infestans]
MLGGLTIQCDWIARSVQNRRLLPLVWVKLLFRAQKAKKFFENALLSVLFLTLRQCVSVSRKRDVRTKPERLEDNSMMSESSS